MAIDLAMVLGLTGVTKSRPSRIMAASIDLSDGVRVGTPQALFSAAAYEQDPFAIPMYDVAEDGRFLMIREPGSAASQISVVLNWTRELLERVPLR